MKKSISYGIAALMAAAVFSGCGKMPQAEIDRANAAIDSARIAGADLYLPDAYNALVDSMNATMVLTEDGPLRSYALSSDAPLRDNRPAEKQVAFRYGFLQSFPGIR